MTQVQKENKAAELVTQIQNENEESENEEAEPLTQILNENEEAQPLTQIQNGNEAEPVTGVQQEIAEESPRIDPPHCRICRVEISADAIMVECITRMPNDQVKSSVPDFFLCFKCMCQVERGTGARGIPCWVCSKQFVGIGLVKSCFLCQRPVHDCCCDEQQVCKRCREGHKKLAEMKKNVV